MDRIKENEKGYALVTVLLTITVFTIISLSFMGQSVNSAKQHTAIEDHNKSVALAEMGVEYFRNAIQNELEKIRLDANQKFYQAYTEYLSNYEQEDITSSIRENAHNHAIKEAIDYAMGETRNKLSIGGSLYELVKNPISIESTSAEIRISNIDIDMNHSSNNATITFNSKGIENKEVEKENHKTIRGKYEVDFNYMKGTDTPPAVDDDLDDFSSIIPDPNPSTTCTITTDNGNKINFIFDNLPDPGCKIVGNMELGNNDNILFRNSKVKINGSLKMGNYNNNDISKTVLYITGNFTAQNLNSLVNAYFYVGGKADLGHFNGSGLEKSTLVFNRSAKMDNVKMEESNIYINGKGTIGQINGMKKSLLYINSDATIKGLDMNGDSTVCVNGKLTIKNNLNLNGTNNYIYAKVDGRQNKDNRVITGSEAFANGGACYRESSHPETNDDDAIVLPKVTEEYEY